MGVYRKNKNSNVWWIDYYYRGKRYRKKIGSKKKDAKKALANINVQIATGEFVPPNERKRQALLEPDHILFETFAKEEFLPWSKTNHSRNHFTRLESIIRVHLIPRFDQLYLHEVTPKMLEDFKNMRRTRGIYTRGKQTKPVADSTINREICALKALFKRAKEWNKLDENPAKDIKTFKESAKPPYLLEEEEIARLLEEAPAYLRAIIACGVYAGPRPSELLHLRWEDINWKTDELTVASLSRQEHHTKNYESRTIPMSPDLIEILRNYPHQPDSPYVFCNPKTGRPYKDVRNSLNSAAKRAGIKAKITMHGLRHAFGSHAQMQGIDVRTVQKWLGHKHLKTTQGYLHVSPNHEKAAIQRLKYRNGHQMDTKPENE